MNHSGKQLIKEDVYGEREIKSLVLLWEEGTESHDSQNMHACSQNVQRMTME